MMTRENGESPKGTAVDAQPSEHIQVLTSLKAVLTTICLHVEIRGTGKQTDSKIHLKKSFNLRYGKTYLKFKNRNFCWKKGIGGERAQPWTS